MVVLVDWGMVGDLGMVRIGMGTLREGNQSRPIQHPILRLRQAATLKHPWGQMISLLLGSG